MPGKKPWASVRPKDAGLVVINLFDVYDGSNLSELRLFPIGGTSGGPRLR